MPAFRHDASNISLYDEFCGGGGTTSGCTMVPGVWAAKAANHLADAIATHRLNFPDAEHFEEDILTLPIDKMGYATMFTASPACPAWTTANGVKRDFDKVNAVREPLFELDGAEDDDDELVVAKRAKDAKRKEEYKRSRLLMKEVPRYLRKHFEDGRPVMIGFVENVVQVRLWAEWDDWIREFDLMNYDIKLISINSMHVEPVRGKKVPQSRNRLIIAFWHRSIGRTPDWDKWLRPKAFCERCVQVVTALQVFKDPTVDVGQYGQQWIYQCPIRTCRTEVFPEVASALSVIDPKIPGLRIGDRRKPLAPATMARIATGVRRYWLPQLVPVGGTWRGDGDRGARHLGLPFPARTTRECDAVAVPPLLVPVEGRPGKFATPATGPIRTQTTRLETGLLMPFMTPLRGGGDRERARPITRPVPTISAGGNHTGIASADAEGTGRLQEWASRLLVPFYGNADSAQPSDRPIGTLTTRDRYGIAATDDFARWEQEMSDGEFAAALEDVLFRMLEPHEVGEAMAFPTDYLMAPKAKKRQVKLYGNAVTPPLAEVVTSALVECLTGQELPRALVSA